MEMLEVTGVEILLFIVVLILVVSITIINQNLASRIEAFARRIEKIESAWQRDNCSTPARIDPIPNLRCEIEAVDLRRAQDRDDFNQKLDKLADTVTANDLDTGDQIMNLEQRLDLLAEAAGFDGELVEEHYEFTKIEDPIDDAAGAAAVREALRGGRRKK